jgi:hypothetical protein
MHYYIRQRKKHDDEETHVPRIHIFVSLSLGFLI